MAAERGPQPGAEGLLQRPRLFEDGWRLFWTQQHGDNNTWEIVPTKRTED